MSDRCIVIMGQKADAGEVGGKAAALSSLARSGLAIPPWVVLTPAAFIASLSDSQRRAFDDGEPIADPRLSEVLARRLHAALDSLGLTDRLLAVRSSGSDEDGAGHSFAGQFDSFLAVPPARLAERVAEVWRSGMSQRLRAYRQEHGLEAAATPPAVLIQEFVDAQAAGVAFGADPVSGRRSVAVVTAVVGLGTSLVGGDADADTWHVDAAGGIAERRLARQTVMDVPDAHSATGTRRQPVDAVRGDRPAIEDDQVRAVATLARRTGRHFGAPQDIEWAIVQGRLLLLQSRPITSLGGIADPDGRLQIWDNANIAESYSGITTPLTFSFARRAYEGVYRQFCLLLRVPRPMVDAHQDTFANMLGLIRGRVYYNLLNWYRMLSLLPGFAVNRSFMEQMMGVSEPLPDEALASFAPASRVQRWRDIARLLRVGGALAREHWRLPRSIRSFYHRLDEALRDPDPPVADMRLDELAEAYRRLERSLITRWDAPLVNDFLAMIFFGALRSLTAKWGGDQGGQLHNHLLCAQGGIISAEPARRIGAMADLARRDLALVNALCDAEADEALAVLRAHPHLREQFDAYRDKFGDRCLEELKLESQTLMDDPTPLLRAIGYTARRDVPAEPPGEAERSMRAAAQRRMEAALRRHPLRRVVFGWVLKHARSRVRDRENLRFERTRLFGRVRRIFVEMGRRLAAEGLLDAPRDVFYLELGELIGFVEGTATCTDLAGLVRVRRADFDEFRQQPPPANRFQTRGAVHVGNDFAPAGRAEGGEPPASDGELRGIGACPGVVRGTVRVIRDPRGIELPGGTIVVAERTDPGWIMLFPAAAGLLVQHGSLLSHSAIVSRELGLPSIVSIPGVTERLRDGQRVEMDGQRGTVRLLDDPSGERGAMP